jgi:hypothetical protein
MKGVTNPLTICRSTTLFLAVVCLPSFGCKRSTDVSAAKPPLVTRGLVTGQVFIVTGGYQSVKLGLVSVEAFDPQECAAAIERVRRQTETEERGLAAIQPTAKEIAAVLKRRNDEAFSTMWAAARSGKTAPIPEHSSEVLAKAEVLANFVLPRRQAFLRSGAPYFKALPRPKASAKTDADGNFRLELPHRGEFIIGAVATRKKTTFG